MTVLSRCLQFNLKQMPQGHIVEHLQQILASEQVPSDAAALHHLAKAAAGSMRDALSLLDQAIAHGAGRVEDAGVRDMLGTVGDDYLYGLLDGLLAGDAPALIAMADSMESRSLSFESALQELATLFHRIALLQFAPEAVADGAEAERLQPYACAFEPEYLQLSYQIAIHGRDDLGLAPDEYAGFTMTLLRLLAFLPDNARQTPAPRPRAVAAAPVSPVTATVKPASEPRQTETPRAASAEPRLIVALPSAGDDWHDLMERLPLGAMARQLATHCELAEQGSEHITLRLPPAHKHLLGRAQQEKLQVELQNHFGRPIKLNIALGEASVETPAERARSVQRERQEQATAAIEGDSFVRDVVDMFGATIDESTIKPV